MFGPPSTRTPSDPAADAENRARLYALLANAWRHPEHALLEALLDPGDEPLFPAPAEGLTESLNAAIRALMEECHRLRGLPRADVLTRFLADYARLFGHAVRGNCPPYELEYGRSEIVQQTAELADLSGFYSAFGLELTDSAFERGDHVSVECEFLGILCAKQAWSLRERQAEAAEACWDTQRLFLRDHLARWLPALAHRVATADTGGFYGRLAALALTLIQCECRSFGIPLGPQWLELRPVDPDVDAAIGCDIGECGVGATERLVQLGAENLAPTGPVP